MTLVGVLFLLAAVAAQAQIGVPTPALPASGATNVPLNARFLWRPVDSAAGYEIELAFDQSFGQIFHANRVESMELYVDGLWDDTTYFWHVRAIDSADGAGAWSPTWSFRTIVTGAPRPTSPADNAADQPADRTTLEFTYPTVAPYGFEVNYAFSPDFRLGSTTLAVTPSMRSASPGVLPFDTVVYWRVRVAAGTAAPGAWSRVMRFRTAAPAPRQLGECTPILPVNGLVTGDPLVGSSWRGSATSGPGSLYHVQFSQDRSMNEVLLDFSELDTTGLEIEMPAAGEWFWRVREISTEEDVVDGPWSELSAFTIERHVEAALGAPSLLLPPNGARARGASVLLAWDSVPGGASYQAEIGRDTTFETSDTTIAVSDFSARVDRLLADTVYAWRVRAIASDGGNSGPWSPHFTFATRGDVLELPGTPRLISPADRETELDPAVLLRWSLAPGAAAHVVQISSDSTFRRDVHGLAAFDSSATAVLEPGRRWWWRVRGANDAGSGAWSEVWTFTTAGVQTSAPLAASARSRSLHLVPTPASSHVQLNAIAAPAGDLRLVIVNMRGEMVLERIVRADADGTLRVDLRIESLATGVYRCRVLSAQGDLVEAPLVVTR